MPDQLSIFIQAARHSVGLQGDYLEFGVWQGRSFYEATIAIEAATKEARKRDWNIPTDKVRYFAFDSFEGLPAVTSVDTGGAFSKGEYSCSQKDFIHNLEKWGVNSDLVTCTKGWYSETLTQETRENLKISKARMIHIDCDLYESTVDVLSFITPLIQDGTILIFDDFLHFNANPDLGEQLAFREWLEQNPQFNAVEFMRKPPWAVSFVISIKPG